MKMPNCVKSVRPLGDYRIKLVFDDGYVAELDLAPIARHPRGSVEEPLADPEFFCRVAVDCDTIVWPNEFDICPDVLRCWCERGRVLSREETDAAFSERDDESLVLREEPPHV